MNKLFYLKNKNVWLNFDQISIFYIDSNYIKIPLRDGSDCLRYIISAEEVKNLEKALDNWKRY